MRRFLERLIALGWALSLCGAIGTAVAVDDVQDLMQSLNMETVKNRAAEVAASQSLDEATKSELAEVFRKIEANLQTTQTYRDATKAFRESIQTSPEEAKRVRAEVEGSAPGAEVDVTLPPGATLVELEQALQKEKSELAALETSAAEVKSKLDLQNARPATIRQRLSDSRNQIIELENVAAGNVEATEIADVALVRRWADLAKLGLLRAEVLMLEQELASQPMRVELLRARRDLADARLQIAQERVRKLENLANKMRLDEAQRARSEAEAVEREVASEHPTVAELAARNTELSEKIDALARAMEGVEAQKQRAADEAKRLEETFNTTRQKIEVAGLSQILGQVLQEQRRALPNPASFEKSARERERRIAETTLSQILLEEERGKLRDIPDYVAGLTRDLPATERVDVAERLAPLAKARRELIDKALATQRRYLQAMGELDFAQSRLADVVERFDAFLDKRLLWVRSTRAVGLDTMRLIPGQVAKMADPASWHEVTLALWDQLRHSGQVWLALAVSLLLLLRRSWLRRLLEHSGRNVGVIDRDRLPDTLLGLGAILLLALPWPLLLLAIGHGLENSVETGRRFASEFGHMLVTLAPLVFQLQALRLFVAPGSVAARHFGWREAGLQRLHRDLGWFMPALVLAAGLTVLTLRVLGSSWGSGLGRLLFMVVMALFALFFMRLAHPSSGTLRLLFMHNPDSALIRLRYLWFALAVSIPVAAMLVGLAGFMYTAGTVIGHILETAWFALAVLIIHQLIVRWLVINQRRLRLQALRARRQAELEARKAKGEAVEGETGAAKEIEEPKVDFKALDATSRKLTNNAMLMLGLLGVWLIWQDVLPALRIFDDVTLWTYTRSGVDDTVPITLTTLAIALLIFVLMIMGTRQFPAFLEITLLQRLNMSQGSRYTVITLTKYTIVAIAVSWIFGLLGGRWSEIQWIFAALGVGIGFGLQEIVANFISGLIILFERPIRVGDVVTVGNTDGVVTRIQIRATTIRNWDRKELLVPNKNFITQELLNWSLSDQTTRIMISVGVAYGSDVRKALQILEKIAKEHPRIMADPPPFVVFDEFGNDALLLSLRCYIDDIDWRLRTITDLNLSINDQFAEAGIEIAFPQRDVHLDTHGPLEIRLQRPGADAG